MIYALTIRLIYSTKTVILTLTDQFDEFLRVKAVRLGLLVTKVVKYLIALGSFTKTWPDGC